MPTVTSGGASSAWEPEREPAAGGAVAPHALVHVVGDGPAPLVLPEGAGSPQVVSMAGGAVADSVPGGVQLPEGWTADEPPAPQGGAPGYGSMTQAALRDEAKARGLPVGGSKADLAARLTEHDAGGAPPTGDGV